MISEHNFTVHKENESFNMQELGIWVNYIQLASPNTEYQKIKVKSNPITLITGVEEKERKVEIELLIEADTLDEYNALCHLVYSIFFSENAFVIERDLYPGESIFVVLEGSYEPEDITKSDGELNFSLSMVDPYVYKQQRIISFNGGVSSLVNNGVVKSPPLFKVTATKESTYLSVSDDKGNFMQLGRQPAESDQAFEPYTLELDKLGNTLVGWTTGNEVDGGIVAGDFTVGGQAFRASGYGTGPAWHGPMCVQALPRLLTDYKIEAFVTLKQGAINQRGRVEVYLMGSGGQRIGKLSMKIDGSESTSNIGEVNIRKGTNSEFLIRTAGVRPRLWNDFYGLLRIEKRGNKFSAYIARIDSGRYNTAWPVEFTDFGNLYTDQLAGIGIHLGAYGTKPPIQDIAIHRIRVYDVNDPSEGQIPIIIETGDIIELDHKHSDIRINGESRPDLKAFAGRFFMLQKGTNLLFLDPPDIGTAEVTFRERFR